MERDHHERNQRFQWCEFTELRSHELYAILKLRQDVFVVEQSCVFADMDGLDPSARHLLMWGIDGALTGTCRILSEDGVAIGRIATAFTVRGTGLGHALMTEAVGECRRLHPASDVSISAQLHLKEFYSQYEFEPRGAPYDEDGIPHVQMIRRSE